ncbi:MAG: 3-phosphoshikimate 1-carboxyvinyltransferase [Acidimicrobiales bacterium]
MSPVGPEVLTVRPAARPLSGRLRVPGDKSISHRALLLGALAEGVSELGGLSTGQDVTATASALAALGASVDTDAAGRTRVAGGHLREASDVIDLGNSGTGIRLLCGLCAALPWFTVLTGDPSIRRRPMGRVVAPLRQMGATVEGRSDGCFAPLGVRGGGLHGIDHEMDVASAQVKSALLLAGLSAVGPTTVHQPAATREHTEELLALAGIDVEVDGLTVRVHPGTPSPLRLDVPGDPSQAAFWIVAACLVPESDLVLEGVYMGPARAGFLDVLKRMGADVEVQPATGGATDLRVRSVPLRATSVGGAEVAGLIDEIPVLAVAAAAAAGTTVFRDASELALKESNRIETIASELSALGIEVEGRPDGLVVHGSDTGFRGGRVRSHGDHRIAMAAAVAALVASDDVLIEGWDAVATSYPGFEEVLARWC